MEDISRPPLGIGWDRLRGWRDQYERMLRWHARLLDEIKTEAIEGNQETWPYGLWDTAMAFFQSAYHLKDWILLDHPEFKDEIESAINTSPRLALCADICNATKHREIDRRRVNVQTTGKREYAPDVPSKSRWLVWGPDGPINLDVLATDIVHAWDRVLHWLPAEHRSTDA